MASVTLARVQLELLVMVVRPAIKPPTWSFSAHWFASFDSADQCQPEQRRNRTVGGAGKMLITTTEHDDAVACHHSERPDNSDPS